MKLYRYFGYSIFLHDTIGFAGTCRFMLAYIKLALFPPRDGALAMIPVGPYVFSFPSLPFFTGLFTEIFFSEHYYVEPTLTRLRVIDCGANIGVSLLYILIRAPHAQVRCFEPNPAARAVLEHNIRANNWVKQVQVFPYALGKEKGHAAFFVNAPEATTSGGSLTNYRKGDHQHSETYPVEVSVLSDYLTDSVDLLKMDIEGAEFDVLEELQNKNALSHIKALQMEYHYFPGTAVRPLSQLLVLLETNGFNTFVKPTTAPHQVINQDTLHTYMVFAWRQP